jgi:ectoine hydroxylase-related dioxygenase (phytanoyl-CoA dioxygenase family)
MAIIRQNLNDLNESIRITNPRSHTMSYFQRNGFCVFRQNLTEHNINPDTVNQMKTEFEEQNFEIVFNDRPIRNTTSRIRAQRLQYLSKILEQDNRHTLDNQVQELLHQTEYQTQLVARRFFSPNHELETVETILYSRANSNIIQNPHTDLGEEYVGNAMLSFVIIHPNTTLIIYPGSHNPENPDRNRFMPRRFAFEVGDIVLFHPLLIHCGDSYREANIRIHYYLFARPRISWQNITFPIRDYVLRLIEWVNEERRAMEAPQQGRAARRGRRAEVRALRQQWIINLNNVRRGA